MISTEREILIAQRTLSAQEQAARTHADVMVRDVRLSRVRQRQQVLATLADHRRIGKRQRTSAQATARRAYATFRRFGPADKTHIRRALTQPPGSPEAEAARAFLASLESLARANGRISRIRRLCADAVRFIKDSAG